MPEDTAEIRNRWESAAPGWAKWEHVLARELYSHEGDDGTEEAGERYEWDNLADEPAHAKLLDELHVQLLLAVASGTVKPILSAGRSKA